MQERLRTGDLRLFKVLGTQNPADMLTKAVARDDLNRYLDLVGVVLGRARAATAPRIAN